MTVFLDVRSKPSNAQEGWSQVYVKHRLGPYGARGNAGTFHKEGYVGIEFMGGGLALDQPKLSQVVSVVRGEEDVGVFKLACIS